MTKAEDYLVTKCKPKVITNRCPVFLVTAKTRRDICHDVLSPLHDELVHCRD